MSQWNLSVRLTGQGSDLSRTLRSTSTDAKAASRDITALRRDISRLRTETARDIRLKLSVDASRLRSQVTAAVRGASSGSGIQIPLGVDARRLRAEVTRALSAAGSGRTVTVPVRLDAGRLRAELGRALSSAGSGRGLTIPVRLDAGRLRAEVSRALAAAGAGRGITVPLRLDARQLRTEVSRALRAAGAGSGITVPLRADAGQLNRDAARATRTLNTLQDQSGETARTLHQVARAARGAGDDLGHLATNATAANVALRSLNTTANRANGRLGDLSTNSRTLRTDLDDLDGSVTRLGGNLGGLRGRLGSVGGAAGDADSGLKLTIGDLGILATALIPVVSSMAPLVAGFAAGGAGAAAFGIAIAGQISAMTEAAEAQKKYEDAVTKSGARSEEAITAQLEYQKVLAKLPAGTREAAASFSILKKDYQAWSDSLSGTTMEPLIKGMQIANTLLPKTSGLVQNTAAEADRFMTILGGGLATPGFDRLNSKFTQFADDTLQHANDSLIHLLRTMDTGAIGGSLSEFMDWARAQGPIVEETLENVGEALLHLLDAGADVGVGVLQVANALSKVVSAVPASTITMFLQLAVALRLVRMAAVGFGAARTMLVAFIAQLLAMQTAAAAVPGRLAAVRAAVLALSRTTKIAMAGTGVGLAILAISEIAEQSAKAPTDIDKLTTSMRTLGETGKTTGEATRVYGKDLSGLADSLRTLTKPSNMQGFVQDMTSFFGMDSTETKNAKSAIDDVDQALANLVKNGQADLAEAALDKVAASMRKQGLDSGELRSKLDDYKSALADQAFEQKLAAESMGIFGDAALKTQSALSAQKQSADGLRQSIQALNDVNRAGLSAQSDFEKAIDDLGAAAKKGGSSLRYVNGELDLNSQRSRDSDAALRDVAAKTEAYAAAARESGASWETVNGIYSRGRGELMKQATAFFGSKSAAEQYVNSILKIPSNKATKLEMRAEDAKASLDAFIEKVKETPNAKSVTVKALTRDAIAILESLGYKVRRLPDGRFSVTALTGSALSNIGAVQAARDRLSSKTITLTTIQVYRTVREQGASPQAAKNYAETFRADGAVVDYYADGGMRQPKAERHMAQIAPAGDWRVWAEPETGGEAYIPLTPAKRPRSRAIAEETVRRLGGDPNAIAWNADGSVTDWRYDPSTGSLYSASDAGSAGNKTKKVKTKVKGKWQTKEVEYFDIGAVEKKLKSASKATTAWNKNLEKVADRVGGDVAEALASMGKEGEALAKKMANGSTKYINEMAAALRNLQKTAKASLSDYTRQLGNANKLNAAFSNNLATLASRGYGDLAKQLAAQNDEAAQQLAAAAVKDPGKAHSANAAAKTANNALTGDQVEQLVTIIAAITNPTAGIHQVAASTGLGEDEIIAVATKAQAQIKASLGGRSAKFLADLVKANKGLAYADGGIRSGIYATRGGAVTFAEPSTGGEAYIPLGGNKRRSAMPVLANVASRFGVGLTDASAGRVVIIRQEAPLVGAQTWNVHSGGNAADTARRIDADNAYQLRRLKRGGVAAR